MSILVLSKRGVSSYSSHGICSREGPPTRQTPESFNHTCLLTRQFDNRSHILTGQLLRCWWCWCQVPPSKLPESIFELHMLLEPTAFFRLQRLSLAKRKALQWNLYEHSKFCDKLWASNCVSKWTSCHVISGTLSLSTATGLPFPGQTSTWRFHVPDSVGNKAKSVGDSWEEILPARKKRCWRILGTKASSAWKSWTSHPFCWPGCPCIPAPSQSNTV